MDDWWWTPATPHAEELLREVHRLLEKGTVKKKRIWLRMLRYVWRVFVECIYLAIVLSLSSVASTKFETVALAILVLVYNAASASASGAGFLFTYLIASLQQVYGDIGQTLRLKIPVLPETDAAKKLTHATAGFFIHSISLSLGSLFALWKIVDTVFL